MLMLGGVLTATEEAPTWTFSNGAAHATSFSTCGAIQFTLSSDDNVKSYAVTPSIPGTALPEQFALESITITKGGQAVSDLWGVVTETATGNALGAVKTQAIVNNAVKFNFANEAITLNAGTSYTLSFIKATNLPTNYKVGSQFLTTTALDSTNKFIVYTVNDTATYLHDDYLRYSDAKINGNYGTATPALSIRVKELAPSVPEPATATLSLLALAGLAARRRR